MDSTILMMFSNNRPVKSIKKRFYYALFYCTHVTLEEIAFSFTSQIHVERNMNMLKRLQFGDEQNKRSQYGHVQFNLQLNVNPFN